jgi:hypothetical protein
LRSRHDELHAQLVETLGAERVDRVRSANATLDLDGGVALAREVLDRIIADGPRRASGDIEWNLENWSRRRVVNP